MKKRVTSLWGMLALFISVTAIVTLSVLVYALVSEACSGKNPVIAGVMMIVILFVSAVVTLADYFRRRFTVERSVSKILEAANAIASGDFSVRIEITHSLKKYDCYDMIAENLNKMAAELSGMEMFNNDFISNVSHELKTPLSVIQNYASCIAAEHIDDKTRMQYAETLVSASRRLTGLVTNILKLNKLENSRIRPEITRIDLTETLSQCVLDFEEQIENKGLKLECDFDEAVYVRTLPGYTDIVFNNLLSNAVKFTEAGGKISVSCKKAEGQAVVTVSDTGCGISAETGKHIFDKFYQGDTSHAQEGNGLGLALVKKVIDITGGTVSVDSEQGKGTAFTVSFNADADEG